MLIIESSKNHNYLVIIGLSLYGFLQQLFLLKIEKKIGTFSIFVPGIVLFVSILKVFFWFIQPFAIGIFVQSFLLMAVHVILF
jgi:hypothetical protein